MNEYTVNYRSVDDNTVTQSYTVTALDDRWALKQANELLASLPHYSVHGWDIDSITPIEQPPAIEPTGSTTTTTTGATA